MVWFLRFRFFVYGQILEKSKCQKFDLFMSLDQFVFDDNTVEKRNHQSLTYIFFWLGYFRLNERLNFWERERKATDPNKRNIVKLSSVIRLSLFVDIDRSDLF